MTLHRRVARPRPDRAKTRQAGIARKREPAGGTARFAAMAANASATVTMPHWPAFLLFAGTVACAYPAVTTPPPAPPTDTYTARGQEPGWLVTITDRQIDYVGNYGETHITVPKPAPRITFNGMRYETDRLVVDITYVRCNDAMSGQGYAHQVLVIAGGQSYRGCGGERRPQWDM